MAQLLGPDPNSRTVTLGGGKSAHGRTATVYSDAEATTLADINVYDGTGTPGAAISGSTVTVGADSLLPRFWFEDDLDTLYVRVNGRSGVQTIHADTDARLDAVVGLTAANAVSDVAALTSAAITGGESPTEAEHNALRTDVVAVRTTVNALLASLRAAGLLDEA